MDPTSPVGAAAPKVEHVEIAEPCRLDSGVSTARGFLCRPHWNGKGNHPQMAFFQVKYGKLLQFTQIY